jgi:C4-dicarboxylate transporter
VVWAQGADGVAVGASDKALRVRNVTAIATGSGSRALAAFGSCIPDTTNPNGCLAVFSPTIDAKNTIARGSQ